MARVILTDAQWAEIRRTWEYDPAEPTYMQAAEKAAAKFGFAPPKKQTIADRAAKEGWERKADLTGVNAAAQRKADRMSLPDGPDAAPDGQADVSGAKKAGGPPGAPPPSPPDPASTQSGREEAEDLRAKVITRHRQEWLQVAQLRAEALVKRPHVKNGAQVAGDVVKAFEAAKLAKITAEMTAIQQAGERKAWGLDVVVDPGQMKNLSDDDLRALAEGRAPRR